MSERNFLKSLTMQGVILTGLGASNWGAPVATILNAVGLPIEPTEIASVIDAGSQIVGIVMTVIGRKRAGGLKLL